MFGDGAGLKMATNGFFEKSGQKMTLFHFSEKKVRKTQKKMSYGPTRKDFLLNFLANER